MEETEVTGELSHNVVHFSLSRSQTHNFSGDISTDCIDICKFKNHTITATTASKFMRDIRVYISLITLTKSYSILIIIYKSKTRGTTSGVGRMVYPFGVRPWFFVRIPSSCLMYPLTWLYDVSSVWGNVGRIIAVIVYNMLLELHVITLQRPYIISKFWFPFPDLLTSV